MPVRDTIALLRDLDPVAAHPAPARRRDLRWPVLATVASAAVAAGLLLASGSERAPGFVRSAYAAVTAEDHILHLRLTSTSHHPQDDPSTTELWSRAGGRQLRLVHDGGEHEFVRDADARSAAGYVRHRNTAFVYTDPEMWQVGQGEALTFGGPEGAVRLVEALPALLARARDGDPAVRRLPDAELDGRPAARLQATTVREVGRATGDGTPPDLRPVEVRTLVWFDLATHLPRRVERLLGARREATVEVVARRLPLDERTRELLDMPARPGAEREVVGAAGR